MRLRWVLFTSDNSFFGKKLWAIREPRSEVWPKENTKNWFCKSDTRSKSWIVNIFSDNQVLPWNFSCLNFLITTTVRAIQLQALKSHQIFCWARHHIAAYLGSSTLNSSHIVCHFSAHFLFRLMKSVLCEISKNYSYIRSILKQPTST